MKSPTSSLTLSPRLRCLLMLGIFTLLVIGSMGALTACGSSAAPADADPLAVYRPALKPEFQADLQHPMPRYAISATLDVDNLILTGTAQIVVPNTSSDPWPDLVFRLYPMLQHYGGNMVVMSALVNGKPATFDYTDDNTAVRVDLERNLLPKQEVTVQLSWRLNIPQWGNQSSLYALFGRSQDMISLPLFYPSLAVYQEGPAFGSGKWWLADGTERGGAAFNVASLFAVTLTLPADYVPVTSGTLLSTTVISSPGITPTLASTILSPAPRVNLCCIQAPHFNR